MLFLSGLCAKAACSEAVASAAAAAAAAATILEVAKRTVQLQPHLWLQLHWQR